MSTVLIGVLIYVVAQFLTGAWVATRVKSNLDYLLAGRTIGPWLATFSIFATWFGAETCIGSAGEIYQHGLSGGRADPFGYTVCLIAMGLFIARPLWRRQIVTLGDLFRTRYGVGVERLAVVVLIPTSVFWAAAQLKAFGTIVAEVAGIETGLALAVSTLLVILYTTLGGLRADIITDLVQGIALIVGLGVLLGAVFLASGAAVEGLATLPAARLSLVPPGESWWQRMDTWAIAILGSLVAQEMISRMMACRSAGVARFSTLAAAGVYLVVGGIPVLLALAGPHLMPGLEPPEQFLTALGRAYLPTLLYVLFAGAIVSAILSTVDSSLLAVSSFITRNLVPVFVAQPSDRALLRVARASALATGIAAYWLATGEDSIFDLVEAASSFGSSGILVITLFGLFTRLGGPWTAAATIVAGTVALPVAETLLELPAPYVATLVTALGVFLAGVTLERLAAARR